MLKDNVQTIYTAGFVIFSVYLINICLTGRVLGCKVVVSTNYTFLNNVLWLLGVLTTAIGVTFLVTQGSFANEEVIPSLLVGTGIVATIAGLIGSLGAFKKSFRLILFNLMLLFIICGVMISAGVTVFRRGDDATSIVSRMTTEEKQQVGKDFGFATLSDEDLEEELEQLFRRMGMSFAISVVLVLIMIVSGVFYAKFTKQYNLMVKRIQDTRNLPTMTQN